MALSHLVQLRDVFCVEKRGVEERGRVLMNEGSFKNRKPWGEERKHAGKRSWFLLFADARFAVNTRPWLGASQSKFTFVK